ncbi:hypothetical protein SLA2020_293400 [Shorea laevis]
MCSPILEMPRVFLTPVASTKFKVHGGPSIGVIRVCYNIALHSKSPINQAMLEAMPTQMISIKFGRMETDPVKGTIIASVEEIHDLAGGADIKGVEAAFDKVVHVEDGKRITLSIDLESISIGNCDALLVFCRLSEMGVKEDTDEVTVKTRILSLEFLQGLLEGVSNSFTKNFHLIDSVKSIPFLRFVASFSFAVSCHISGFLSSICVPFLHLV